MPDTTPTVRVGGTVPIFERTEAGALLRSGLDELAALPIPEGQRGRLAVVTDMDNVELGVAWKTERGWRIDANVSAAVKNGRKVRVGASVSW